MPAGLGTSQRPNAKQLGNHCAELRGGSCEGKSRVSMLRRRTAIKLIGGAFVLSNAALAGDSKRRWKTAIGLNGFASSSGKYRKTFPIWEVLDFASRAKFDGVELVDGWPMGGYPQPDETDRVRALKGLYDSYGLSIFSLQLGAGDAFSADANVRKRWVERFRQQARFAKAVGCECIGLWPGGALGGQTLAQATRHLGQSFHEAATIAGDLGLVVAFEIEPPFVFHTEADVKRILDESHHPRLKAIYDPSHYDLMNGSTGKPHEMLRRVNVANIGYVQLTDSDGTLRDGGTSKHLPCGDGHIDIAASLATLWEGGFSGWIMIDAWEVPDPYDACLKGKRAIDKFLGGV
jgi:sugar phosphate isomerase/epimerase